MSKKIKLARSLLHMLFRVPQYSDRDVTDAPRIRSYGKTFCVVELGRITATFLISAGNELQD